MNTPNKLTILRILLSPVFIVLFLDDSLYFRLGALLVFIIAAATDIADGYLARRTGVITRFGTFIDPLADKILVSSAFIAFVALDYARAWMVAVIIGREFLITGLRSLAAYQGTVISSSPGAKIKTAMQMISVALILVYINVESIYEYRGETISLFPPEQAKVVFDWLLGITAGVTALTGIEYVVRYYPALKNILR